MIIRKATPQDTKEIATYMMLAMEDIVYEFIGENSKEKALSFLEKLILQKDNQYSYENCWVIDDNGNAIAVANVYNGADLEKLRTPVASLVKTMFNRDSQCEDETEKGEFYIDCKSIVR